jgi:hypothetical protein
LPIPLKCPNSFLRRPANIAGQHGFFIIH